MESIVISQPKLRKMIFTSFFSDRQIRGWDLSIGNVDESGFDLIAIPQKIDGEHRYKRIKTHYAKKGDYFYPHGEPLHSLNWDDILRFLIREVSAFLDEIEATKSNMDTEKTSSDVYDTGYGQAIREVSEAFARKENEGSEERCDRFLSFLDSKMMTNK